tara:strand:- start:16 stop:213 length:198 start_codon:yes stop_codon:yes gene_type:complete
MKFKKLLIGKFLQEYLTVFKEDGFKGVLRKEGWKILFLYVFFDKRFNIIYSYTFSSSKRFFLLKI